MAAVIYLLVCTALSLGLAVVRPNLNILHAVKSNDIQTLKQLLSKANPVLVAESIDAAVSSGGHVEVFKMLLPLAEDVSSNDYFDIIVKAMDSGMGTLVDIILPASNSPLTSSQRESILYLASRSCRVDIVQKFVVNFQEYQDSVDAVLIGSILNRHQEFCDDDLQDEIILLLFNVASEQPRAAALRHAVREEHAHLVSKFLDYSELTGDVVSDALNIAVTNENPSFRILRIVLSDPRITVNDRKDAVMSAALWCYPGPLELLLDYDDHEKYNINKVFVAAATTSSPKAGTCISMLIDEPEVLPRSIRKALDTAILLNSLDRVQLIMDSERVSELQQFQAFRQAMVHSAYSAAVPLQPGTDIESLYDDLTLLDLCADNDEWDGVVELIRLGAEHTSIDGFLAAAHSGDVERVAEFFTDVEVSDDIKAEALEFAAGVHRMDTEEDTQANVDTMSRILNSAAIPANNIHRSFAASLKTGRSKCMEVLLPLSPVSCEMKVQAFRSTVESSDEGQLAHFTLLLGDPCISENSELLGNSLVLSVESELLYSVEDKQIAQVKLLSQASSVTSKQILLAFNSAISAKRFKLAALLVSKDAVNIQYEFGNTLLHRMARDGEYELVDRLISLGATLSILNDFGKSYIHCAAGERGIALRHELMGSQMTSNLLYTKLPEELNRLILEYNHAEPIAEQLSEHSVDSFARRTLQRLDQQEEEPQVATQLEPGDNDDEDSVGRGFEMELDLEPEVILEDNSTSKRKRSKAILSDDNFTSKRPRT